MGGYLCGLYSDEDNVGFYFEDVQVSWQSFFIFYVVVAKTCIWPSMFLVWGMNHEPNMYMRC